MTVRVLIAIVTHNSAEVIAECVERLAGLCDAADFQRWRPEPAVKVKTA